ncbi:MAG: serine/threonine protein kinase [Planctomycetes bacterium]|nr:serine/threonine protein kinase [Planctomycetota bacterium]
MERLTDQTLGLVLASEIRRGTTAPSRDEIFARHPELRPRLEECFASLDFLHGIDSSGEAEPQRIGDFRIQREIGRGGMGVVYEAEQISLRRSVALKVLPLANVWNQRAVKLFEREARAVALLHHTHIVPIFAVGNERGVYYYAMQLIDGKNLAQLAEESKRRGESHPGHDLIARWGLEIAEALEYAHGRGVIHRDVKPSNILVDSLGQTWLTDFGLARRARGSRREPGLMKTACERAPCWFARGKMRPVAPGVKRRPSTPHHRTRTSG